MPQNILDFLNLVGQQSQPMEAMQPAQDNGLAQQILSARFQPNLEDASRAGYENFQAQAYGKPATIMPQDYADQRMQNAMKQLQTVTQLQKISQGSEKPSAVQEYEYYNKLAPDQQQAYLNVKRNPQFLNTGDSFRNPMTGMVISKGIPPQDSPLLKGEQERLKKQAEIQTQGQADLPRIADQAEFAINQIGQTLDSPGLAANFGMSGVVPNRPGSDASNAAALLDQIKGGAFLTAYGQLRGGGAITEVEGEKATNAYARMQKAQSIQSFRQAAKDYISVIQKGVQRARNTASGNIFNNSSIANSGGLDSVDPRIAAARNAGYSDEEIQRYLQGGQ